MNSDPNKCCGQSPKQWFETHDKKWFFNCMVCGKATSGHTTRKKALESWNRL